MQQTGYFLQVEYFHEVECTVGLFWSPPHPRTASKRPILNKVNFCYDFMRVGLMKYLQFTVM